MRRKSTYLVVELDHHMESIATVADTTLLFDVPWKAYAGLVDALPEHRIRHTYDNGTLELFSSLIYDVSWKAYEEILTGFGDRRFPHTFQDGTLEILMSPSEDHEQIKGFVGRMIETMSVELRVRTKSVGTATRRDRKLMQGLEPDESYYLWPVEESAGGESVKSGVPDLVVEIDMRRTHLKRLKSYAKLGVREVWRYHKGNMEFYGLAKRATLKPIDRSIAFPEVSADDFTRFIKQMQQSDEYSTILEFTKWLRKQARKN